MLVKISELLVYLPRSGPLPTRDHSHLYILEKMYSMLRKLTHCGAADKGRIANRPLESPENWPNNIFLPIVNISTHQRHRNYQHPKRFWQRVRM